MPDAVVDAAKTGDELAWVTLYDTYTPALYGYVRTHGSRDADEVVARVWEDAARRIGGFAGDGDDLRRWLVTIARHRLVDERRWWHRRPRSSVDATSLVGIVDPDAAGDPAAAALAKAGAESAAAALSCLSAAQREVVALVTFGQLTLAEVATHTGVPLNTVKSHWRRGIEALRGELHPDGRP